MVIPGIGCAIDTATGATDTVTGAMETGGTIPWVIVCTRAAERGVISVLRWGSGAVGGAVLVGGIGGAPVEATRSCWMIARGSRAALLRVVWVWAMLWLYELMTVGTRLCSVGSGVDVSVITLAWLRYWAF